MKCVSHQWQADAFRNQLEDPNFKEVPFEDQFGMLVDIEYSNHKNNRFIRLIKNTGFDQSEANIMDINYAFIVLEISRTESNYKKVMAKYASPLADAIIRPFPMTVIASTSQA